MGYLVQGYCHPLLEEAAFAAFSYETTQQIGGQILQPLTVEWDEYQQLITIIYQNLSNYSEVTASRSPPLCGFEGKMVEQSYWSNADITELSWLVLGVFAVAWATVAIRRAL